VKKHFFLEDDNNLKNLKQKGIWVWKGFSLPTFAEAIFLLNCLNFSFKA
jgi:hypothetical protein